VFSDISLCFGDICLWLLTYGLRSSLFWHFTHRRLVGCYRRFGTSYRFHLQRSSIPRTQLPSKLFPLRQKFTHSSLSLDDWMRVNLQSFCGMQNLGMCLCVCVCGGGVVLSTIWLSVVKRKYVVRFILFKPPVVLWHAEFGYVSVCVCVWGGCCSKYHLTFCC